MHIEVKLLATICIVVDSDSTKTGASNAMYEKNTYKEMVKILQHKSASHKKKKHRSI